MLLKAIIDDLEYSLQVPSQLLTEAEDFFDQLDADMDQGWQMSREWVAQPNQIQRGQIVANKLLTALEKGNNRLGMLMAAYLLKRLPGLEAVELDTHGEIQNIQFFFGESEAQPTPVDPQRQAQVENEITPVFKAGKGYRFSLFDAQRGQWQNSPLFATEADAEAQRQAAIQQRLNANP